MFFNEKIFKSCFKGKNIVECVVFFVKRKKDGGGNKNICLFLCVWRNFERIFNKCGIEMWEFGR